MRYSTNHRPNIDPEDPVRRRAEVEAHLKVQAELTADRTHTTRYIGPGMHEAKGTDIFAEGDKGDLWCGPPLLGIRSATAQHPVHCLTSGP